MTALAPHIHLALLGEDVVLLDIRSDAYLCVPGGRAHLQPHPDGVHVSPTPEACEALAAAGFLAHGADMVQARPSPARPSRSLDGSLRAEVTSADAWRLVLAATDLLFRYWRRDLGGIIAFVACAQPAATAAGDLPAADLERLALVFHRLSPWLPISRKCLVRSFVLRRFLQRSGARADWVFGVATWPFAAHCWIQSGDLVLDDHWERLLAYEPILVVR
jgi:hypothetical protein